MGHQLVVSLKNDDGHGGERGGYEPGVCVRGLGGYG